MSEKFKNDLLSFAEFKFLRELNFFSLFTMSHDWGKTP